MQIFVSYSSHDQDAVRSLVEHLESGRHQVWMDQKLAVGEAWWTAILEQVRACTVFVFALSDNSLRSKPCRAEASYAEALGLPILPVQIGEVGSYRIDPIFTRQMIDYRQPTVQTGIALIGALHEAAEHRQDLPDPPPDPPPIPYEYLLLLGKAIDADEPISYPQQGVILTQLRQSFFGEDDPGVRADIRRLLGGLRQRPDTANSTIREIDYILQSESADLKIDSPTTPTEHPAAETRSKTEPAARPAVHLDRTPATSIEPPSTPSGADTDTLGRRRSGPRRRARPIGDTPTPAQDAHLKGHPESKMARRAAMSRREWGCVLCGVALLGVAMADCLVPWRAVANGGQSGFTGSYAVGFTWVLIIGTIPGVALLLLGRWRASAGRTVAGCALVSLGLSTLLFLQGVHIPWYPWLDPILAVAGLLQILVPMRRHALTSPIASGYFFSGAGVLLMVLINGFALEVEGFFGDLSGWGCSFRPFVGPDGSQVQTHEAWYWVCTGARRHELAGLAIAAVTGLVLVVAGATAWWSARRSANSRGSSARLP